VEVIKCKNCKQELTENMEVEYSDEINEFFCKPDCATDYYYDLLRSGPVIDDEKRTELKVKIIDGKLHKEMYS
jgi:hypothetical protein